MIMIMIIINGIFGKKKEDKCYTKPSAILDIDDDTHEQRFYASAVYLQNS